MVAVQELRCGEDVINATRLMIPDCAQRNTRITAKETAFHQEPLVSLRKQLQISRILNKFRPFLS